MPLEDRNWRGDLFTECVGNFSECAWLFADAVSRRVRTITWSRWSCTTTSTSCVPTTRHHHPHPHPRRHHHQQQQARRAATDDRATTASSSTSSTWSVQALRVLYQQLLPGLHDRCTVYVRTSRTPWRGGVLTSDRPTIAHVPHPAVGLEPPCKIGYTVKA